MLSIAWARRGFLQDKRLPLPEALSLVEVIIISVQMDREMARTGDS
jgi:hypothetical protein